tara:strand:+ start:1255 stop:1524 length:270 start_codon:yes stop_codon:yes gene_type:complete
MNLRQKAKKYKGSYRYNLTVCKAYRKEISFLNGKLKKYEDIDIDLLIKEHDRLAEKVLEKWPECCECNIGLSNKLYCNSCHTKMKDKTK